MKSMLIIDGSRTLVKLFAEIFEKRRWTVATCGDRECAIRGLAGKQLYHAIVLSDRVPGTNGAASENDQGTRAPQGNYCGYGNR